MPLKRLGLLLPLLLAACAQQTTGLHPPVSASPAAKAKEQAVTLIPLAGDIDSKKAELSGLAWYKDTLLLLPQFPDFGQINGDGHVFAIPKSEIIASVDGKSSAPLRPREIPFFAEGIPDKIKDYQGFEAIVMNGEKVYLSIETGPPSMMSYLVQGTLKSDLSELRLDAKTLIPIPPQAKIKNAAYEALSLNQDKLIALYEGNGKNMNPRPSASMFAAPSLNPLPSIPFPNIEYRITDATTSDNKGKFWAINFFFPGDRESYKTGTDDLATHYGQGATHAKLPQVERLVEFQYTPTEIRLTDTPPIQLQLIEEDSRNWEGIVRLDDRGFLLVTDTFPGTMLGFVPRTKQ